MRKVGDGHAVAVEDTEAEFLHDGFHGCLGFDGVAGFIQRRSKGGYTEYTGEHTEHTAAYTTLGRDTGGVEPVAGVLIETYGGYHGGDFWGQ